MRVAVIGATGAVGREMLADIEELSFIKEVHAFASPRSEGEHLPFRDSTIRVRAFNLEAMRNIDYVLMSAGGAFSRDYSEKIAAQGPIVIDNSSAFRKDPLVPLVVPEVNADDLAHIPKGIVANPNCSTIQMVVSLKPLAEHFGLKTVIVSTYQSVSGAGQKGIQELSEQVHASLRFAEPQANIFPEPIAFNLIPYIGQIDANKNCEEENKMIYETRRMLKKPQLEVFAQCVRVPVLSCHSEALFVCLEKKVTIDEVKKAFAGCESLILCDENPKDFATPRKVTQRQEVFVSRVRFADGNESGNWLQYWNVADNLKKGAATNAVQILKILNDRRVK